MLLYGVIYTYAYAIVKKKNANCRNFFDTIRLMPYGESKKAQHGFRLDLCILQKIREIARQEHRSMNEVANGLFKKALKSYDPTLFRDPIDELRDLLFDLRDRVDALENAAFSGRKKKPSKR